MTYYEADILIWNNGIFIKYFLWICVFFVRLDGCFLAPLCWAATFLVCRVPTAKFMFDFSLALCVCSLLEKMLGRNYRTSYVVGEMLANGGPEKDFWHKQSCMAQRQKPSRSMSFTLSLCSRKTEYTQIREMRAPMGWVEQIIYVVYVETFQSCPLVVYIQHIHFGRKYVCLCLSRNSNNTHNGQHEHENDDGFSRAARLSNHFMVCCVFISFIFAWYGSIAIFFSRRRVIIIGRCAAASDEDADAWR